MRLLGVGDITKDISSMTALVLGVIGTGSGHRLECRRAAGKASGRGWARSVLEVQVLLW
jgi:hypothetical protein